MIYYPGSETNWSKGGRAQMAVASGATTLLFKDNKFLIPQTDFDSLKDEHQLSEQMIKNLHPQDGDVIIIGSDNYSRMKAEFAAKSAALITIMNHEKH